MPTLETWLLFVPAALLLGIAPGPGVLYVLSRSLAQGRGAGLASAAGLAGGGLLHVAAAALGLSAIFAASPTLYQIVKLAGAAYLIYLGISEWRQAGTAQAAPRAARQASLGRIALQGVLVEALNPKTALFFLALLPQFVAPAQGAVASQMLLLGGFVTLVTLSVDLAVAFGSGSIAALIARRPLVQRIQARLSGSILCALGLRVALDPAR